MCPRPVLAAPNANDPARTSARLKSRNAAASWRTVVVRMHLR
jgi:hypothetical protein